MNAQQKKEKKAKKKKKELSKVDVCTVFHPTRSLITWKRQPGMGVGPLPCIISLTVSLPVSDEASAGLVQVLAALGALEAGCVPLQVGGHSQDVLVVYLTPTAHTHRDSRLLCVTVRHTLMHPP